MMTSSVQKSDIPKTVHFCWLSNDPYPVLIKNCLASWKKHLPGYEFVHWDLAKAEAIDSLWLKQAIAAKKYAFAADFIRIYTLFHFGGIYLDADVELLGSLDPFLTHKFFIGFEFNDDIEPAIFGSVAGHPLLRDLLAYYHERPFIKSDGNHDIRPLPYIFNEKAGKFGIVANGQKQVIKEEGIAVYPCEIFSPKNIYFKNIKTTSNTVAIHHFDGAGFEKIGNTG
jgi:hypothetical protein